MGNEVSNMFEDGGASRKLESRTLEGLAKLITSGDVKNIVVMVCIHSTLYKPPTQMTRR